MTIQPCSSNFCGSNKRTFDITCHDLKKKAGSWIIIFNPPNPECYCICSCLATDTPVATKTGAIKVQDIQRNKSRVLAAGKDLKFSEQLVELAERTSPGETKNTVYLSYELDGKEQRLVCTMDHPFLLYDGKKGKLVTADILQTSDQLIDRNGKPVKIKKILLGSYNGIFYEFATKMETPDSNLSNHLVLTNGVVTGDFAISVYMNNPDFMSNMMASSSMDEELDRPVIGSPEWLEKNNVSLKPEPMLNEAVTIIDDKFLPAHEFHVEIPENASDFLPSWQAAFLQYLAPSTGHNNPYYQEMCEWIIDKVFKPIYPDVTYLFNWYGEEVNAHSWVDENEKKIVYLSGGLARIEGFEYEGLCLAIAHELGHFYGKPDGSPSGVTCEGEADYFGMKIIMRELWYGTQYGDNAYKAISQLEKMYEYLKLPLPTGKENLKQELEGEKLDKMKRPYPSNKCRLETFKNAMSLAPKPECAGCNGDSDGTQKDSD